MRCCCASRSAAIVIIYPSLSFVRKHKCLSLVFGCRANNLFSYFRNRNHSDGWKQNLNTYTYVSIAFRLYVFTVPLLIMFSYVDDKLPNRFDAVQSMQFDLIAFKCTYLTSLVCSYRNKIWFHSSAHVVEWSQRIFFSFFFALVVHWC